MRRFYFGLFFGLLIALVTLIFVLPVAAQGTTLPDDPLQLSTLNAPTLALIPTLPATDQPSATSAPSVTPQPGITPMPITVKDVQANVDQWSASLLITLQTREDAYFAAHGRYWQALSSDSQDLTYTSLLNAAAIPDNLLSHPSDESENWLSLLPEIGNGTAPAVMRVDVYDGPDGQGYVTLLRYCFDAQCYERADNHGPELWRSHDWMVVQP